MADFGEEELFTVFDSIEQTKEKASVSGVTDGSVKRIFLQRGEKRGHEESVDVIDSVQQDGAGGDEKLKRVKKADDER